MPFMVKSVSNLVSLFYSSLFFLLVPSLTDALEYKVELGILGGKLVAFVQYESLMTLSKANETCVSLEGHLPILHSKSETQQLLHYFEGFALWLGVETVRQKRTSYKWTDGTLDYTPWNTNKTCKYSCCGVTLNATSNKFRLVNCERVKNVMCVIQFLTTKDAKAWMLHHSTASSSSSAINQLAQQLERLKETSRVLQRSVDALRNHEKDAQVARLDKNLKLIDSRLEKLESQSPVEPLNSLLKSKLPNLTKVIVSLQKNVTELNKWTGYPKAAKKDSVNPVNRLEQISNELHDLMNNLTKTDKMGQEENQQDSLEMKVKICLVFVVLVVITQVLVLLLNRNFFSLCNLCQFNRQKEENIYSEPVSSNLSRPVSLNRNSYYSVPKPPKPRGDTLNMRDFAENC